MIQFLRCRWRIFFILLIVVVSVPCFSQELTAVFPQPNDTVQFLDLVQRGFEFQFPEGATKFRIRIQGPPSLVLLPPLQATSSPYHLPQNFAPLFENGSYQWQVEITEGTGIGAFTEWTPFSIGVVVNLRPSPTPLHPEPPFGDLDNSDQVDVQDILIFSNEWGKQTDEPYQPMDLNQDQLIDSQDLLLYLERFGQPVPTPTPTPPIGKPENIFYEPGQSVHMSQSNLLVIRWSPPSYPEEGQFLYDILIAPPYGTDEIIGTNLQTTSFSPFETITTRTGLYRVYLQAKDMEGRKSNIVSSSFELGFTQTITTPTPTPKPLDPDLFQDNQMNSLDLMMFANSFGIRNTQPNFVMNADFVPDGYIGLNDLLVFRELLLARSDVLSAPIWLYADVPILQMDGFVPVEVGRQQIDFPPNEILIGQTNPQLKYAELNGSTFHFTPVEGAVDYQVTVESEIYGDSFQIFPGREFTTKGETVFQIVRTQPDRLVVQVRAIDENSKLGDISEILRIIIPE